MYDGTSMLGEHGSSCMLIYEHACGCFPFISLLFVFIDVDLVVLCEDLNDLPLACLGDNILKT